MKYLVMIKNKSVFFTNGTIKKKDDKYIWFKNNYIYIRSNRGTIDAFKSKDKADFLIIVPHEYINVNAIITEVYTEAAHFLIKKLFQGL